MIPWRGSDAKNRKGADPSKVKGPVESNRADSKAKVKGPEAKNRRGPLGLFRRKKKPDPNALW